MTDWHRRCPDCRSVRIERRSDTRGPFGGDKEWYCPACDERKSHAYDAKRDTEVSP